MGAHSSFRSPLGPSGGEVVQTLACGRDGVTLVSRGVGVPRCEWLARLVANANEGQSSRLLLFS